MMKKILILTFAAIIALQLNANNSIWNNDNTGYYGEKAWLSDRPGSTSEEDYTNGENPEIPEVPVGDGMFIMLLAGIVYLSYRIRLK